jgi:hypothetical protein
MGGPDPLHAEVARIALSAAHEYGFALGGGLALVVHGVVDRPTEDVDVFSDVAMDVSLLRTSSRRPCGPPASR